MSQIEFCPLFYSVPSQIIGCLFTISTDLSLCCSLPLSLALTLMWRSPRHCVVLCIQSMSRKIDVGIQSGRRKSHHSIKFQNQLYNWGVAFVQPFASLHCRTASLACIHTPHSMLCDCVCVCHCKWQVESVWNAKFNIICIKTVELWLPWAFGCLHTLLQWPCTFCTFHVWGVDFMF